MRKEYDFTAATENPCAARLKKQITIRLEEEPAYPSNQSDITMSDTSCLKYENARFPQSSFVAVDLCASAFEDVNLRQAVFANVALTGAAFRNVDLASASIDDANLDRLRIDGILVSDLFSAYNQVNPT